MQRHIARLLLVGVLLVPLLWAGSRAFAQGGADDASDGVVSGPGASAAQTLNFMVPEGWSGAYSPSDGFLFASAGVPPLTVENPVFPTEDTTTIPGLQIVTAIPLPPDSLSADDDLETLYTRLAPAAVGDDTRTTEPDVVTDAPFDYVAGAVVFPSGAAGWFYLIDLGDSFVALIGQIGAETAAVNAGTLRTNMDFMAQNLTVAGTVTAVETLTATDPLTEQTLSFDYPVDWAGVFVSGGGGFLFANSTDAFAAAEASLLQGRVDAMPENGQALVVIPLPDDFFESAESLDQRFEVIRALYGGDEAVGPTEDVLVGDFAARRAALLDDTVNGGLVYLVDAEHVGDLLVAVVYEASAAAQLPANITLIVGSVSLGDITQTINPADALPNSTSTLDGTFSIGYPSGWVFDPDTGTLASNPEALEAALAGAPVPQDTIAITVTTPADLTAFFGISGDQNAQAVLQALYSLLDIDEPVLQFPVLNAPAVIAVAPPALIPGQGVFIGVNSPTGTILYGVQYTGTFSAIEPIIIPILGSGVYTPANN